MKQIIDEYSPILEGVEVEEIKQKIKETKAESEITLPKPVDVTIID